MNIHFDNALQSLTIQTLITLSLYDLVKSLISPLTGAVISLTGLLFDMTIMYTLNIDQSNVSTKLKIHDFVIPEIEVTSQLIDLRSLATLC